MFIKYPHVEKLGHLEVEGLELGLVHVFPKLDGANCSTWIEHRLGFEGHAICAGSRRRTLSLEDDNHGFLQWLTTDHAALGLRRCIQEVPGLRLYGEWLVPHTFKGYRDDAWRRYYVFDAYDDAEHGFLHHNRVAAMGEAYGFAYVPPLAVVDHPSTEQLLSLLESNTYLCQDGAGPGEGIVLKRYDYRNRFGRTTWAKMVRAEFKDRHKLVMGVDQTKGPRTTERDAAEKYCTEAFVAKERAKVEQLLCEEHFKGQPAEHWVATAREYLASRECRRELIPRLLQTCYYEVVREHAWDFGGKLGATVDFKQLRRCVQEYVKAFAEDLF